MQRTTRAGRRLAVGVLMTVALAGAASGQEERREDAALADAPTVLADAAPTPALSVRLAKDDEASRRTRDQLLRLLEEHDLAKWIFTRDVVIDSGSRVIPHSHPVLTLSTRHLLDDELLLATFVHEQIHWHLAERGEATMKAKADLRRLFPQVPVGHPEGARDEESTYSHLIVCYLEKRALQELLGELRAHWVIEFWSHDHYTWVYRMVLERGFDLYSVVDEHGLSL